MPTILSHPAVPIAIAMGFGKSIPAPLTGVAVVCSILPDIDGIGYALGVPYEHLCGHRGITHGLCFAIAVALVGSLFWRQLGAAWWVVAVVLFVSTASHGVLDAMTSGGLGIAFHSPFSNHRYFLPWQPIEVSPLIITAFFSRWGLAVLRSEVVWVWVPCLGAGFAGLIFRHILVGSKPALP